MIPGYSPFWKTNFGCWNCRNSSTGDNAVMHCDRYGEKVTGCGGCPQWDDWLLDKKEE